MTGKAGTPPAAVGSRHRSTTGRLARARRPGPRRSTLAAAQPRTEPCVLIGERGRSNLILCASSPSQQPTDHPHPIHPQGLTPPAPAPQASPTAVPHRHAPPPAAREPHPRTLARTDRRRAPPRPHRRRLPPPATHPSTTFASQATPGPRQGPRTLVHRAKRTPPPACPPVRLSAKPPGQRATGHRARGGGYWLPPRPRPRSVRERFASPPLAVFAW